MQLRLPFVFVCTLAVLLLISMPVQAAGESGDAPLAVTTVNPNIPSEELALILYPFAKNELIVEADAWQKLVKEKAIEIARAEIEVRHKTEGLEKAKEVQEQAEAAREELAQVKAKAEQARKSGDSQAMEEAEKLAQKAQKEVGKLKQTVTDALSDVSEQAADTSEIYDRMAPAIKEGLTETVIAAHKAHESVQELQEAVGDAADQEEDEAVKKGAAKAEQASRKAGAAIDKVAEKAQQTAERAAVDAASAKDTAQLVKNIREQTSDVKIDLLERLNLLREERTIRVDNLRAVVDELAAKTDSGDKETQAKIIDYQLYIRGVSGINLDLTDTTSAWVTIRGWITSNEGGLRWAKNFAFFLAILVGAWFLSILSGSLMRKGVNRMKLPALLSQFLVGSVRWLVRIIGVILALMSLEISITPMLAVVGAAGFIIAFALQDSLSNVASGLMILFFRPFDVGDLVEAGGVNGKVTSLNLVATTIRTLDNKAMIVPNNSIINNVITNSTSVNKRRVDMEFRIRYDADIDQTISILTDIVSNHPQILKDPAPTIKVSALNDSSVNLICRPWTGSGEYWNVYWDVTEAVKKRFDAEGLDIPYPQQDVHVYIQDTPVSRAMARSKIDHSGSARQIQHGNKGLDEPDE